MNDFNNKYYLKFYHTNKHFYTQVILKDQILMSSSTLDPILKNKIKDEHRSLMNSIPLVIDDLVSKLRTKEINSLRISKNNYKYHGKIKYFLDLLKDNQISLY